MENALIAKDINNAAKDRPNKGEMMPIFANARDKTSYNILMKQINALGQKVGCRFEIKEIGSHQADSSTMHDVLIIPHKI